MRNSRRLIALLSFLLMVQSPLSVLAGTAYPTYEEYRGGTVSTGGTKKAEADYTVITIESEEDLFELAQSCQLDTWSADKYVSLNADIILQKYTDVSIPSFAGIFEGNGHTISGLCLTAEGSAVGLFRYIQAGGVVRNLHVEGKITPDGSQNMIGGIAGINYGEIFNCSVSGKVSGDSQIGGIAGVNEETGEIRRCSSDAVVVGNHSVGGIVGENHGTLNHCNNTGNVNTYTTEVSYNLEDFTMDNLEELNSTDNVAAHTDSGGIAGISDGKIYYCTNSGTIGYSHVGYNIGGIVGRLHQGYVQNCTNTGHILGRKDVGGIAGQMEPFLEIQYLSDKLQELDNETAYFLELLETAYQEGSRYGDRALLLTKNISQSLRGVSGAAKELTATANELWYIYNNELTGMNQDLKALGNDWAEVAKPELPEIPESPEIPETPGDITLPDISVSDGDAIQDFIEDSLNDRDSGNDKQNDSKNDSNVSTQIPSINADSQIKNDMESYLTALQKFGQNTSVHIENMTQAKGERTKAVNDNLALMNQEMESAGNSLEQLVSVLEQGADQTSSDMDALAAQAKVLKNLMQEIRDDLFRYEGITLEDTSDEAASDTEAVSPGAGEDTEERTDENTEAVYYDTTSFQQGKITLCMNKGLVEADTNVGGIVGQVATEYDFDPEEDITLTGTESFDVERTVKAVVRDSCNLGDVISKKDCAGGIVGKAEFGAVISCESYGDISSTGGSNVGGIAGTSAYAIRSCYTMGTLSGKNNVGGIAGKGSDIFYSYAYNTLEAQGECAGAIAGSVQESGTLYGNYYVAGSTGGVDGIGYSGGATPLTYEEFRKGQGVPEAFSNFTITFVADGEELAVYHCGYGDSLSAEQIPEIPEKEGYYGVWQEFDSDNIRGNQVVEAVYERFLTSLASAETDENGRAKVLVEGTFLPEQKLSLTEDNGEISFCIESNTGKDEEAKQESTDEYRGAVEVRVLCEDTENAIVEVKGENGFTKAETAVKGSYLLFSMEEPGTFRVTYAEKNSMIIWYVTGGIILLALAAMFLLFRKRIAARKAKKTGGTTEQRKKEEEHTNEEVQQNETEE